MRELIGQTAGKIWKTLQKNESVTISNLPKVVNEKQAIVFQSLGWLARENKIEYTTKGKSTQVSLHK